MELIFWFPNSVFHPSDSQNCPLLEIPSVGVYWSVGNSTLYPSVRTGSRAWITSITKSFCCWVRSCPSKLHIPSFSIRWLCAAQILNFVLFCGRLGQLLSRFPVWVPNHQSLLFTQQLNHSPFHHSPSHLTTQPQNYQPPIHSPSGAIGQISVVTQSPRTQMHPPPITLHTRPHGHTHTRTHNHTHTCTVISDYSNGVEWRFRGFISLVFDTSSVWQVSLSKKSS